jgi:hypothetical protein
MRTINMEAAQTLAPTAAPTLERVAHSQSNELHDVVALLAAIADRIEARVTEPDDSLHHTLRLAYMARERVDSVISAFDPYI